MGGAWTGLYSTEFMGNNHFQIAGWYPRNYSNHLPLGQGGFSGVVPMCQQWIGVQPLIDCTTTRVTSASAQLKNGTIVLVEDDYYRFVDPWNYTPPSGYVQGGFSLRFPNGRETPLAGHPSDTTKFVVAEAHRNTAWAVTGTQTDTGWKSYLQRYEG